MDKGIKKERTSLNEELRRQNEDLRMCLADISRRSSHLVNQADISLAIEREAFKRGLKTAALVFGIPETELDKMSSGQILQNISQRMQLLNIGLRKFKLALARKRAEGNEKGEGDLDIKGKTCGECVHFEWCTVDTGVVKESPACYGFVPKAEEEQDKDNG